MPRSRSRSFEVHGALHDALVLAERAGLLQQPIDQRGLAMVDVSDDGNIAKVHGVPKPKRAPEGPAILAGI